MALFEINTVSTYRHKYVVDAASLEEAYDCLRKGRPDELSSRYLSEVITDGREVTNAQVDQIIDKLENDEEGQCANNMHKKICKDC
jgi:hypothetical protein